jgi:uncharacterized protein YbjT (DUF2867 family)
MKILIIGASGLLGGPVIRRLDQAGFSLRLFSRSVDPTMFDKAYDIVQGDLYNPADLERAMLGCDAVHISISNLDEVKATAAILEMAGNTGISRVSMVSGCTVSEENRWFRFVDDKFRAEQMIMGSGIAYFIFRPTWFFESLGLMVRGGKATILGKNPNAYRWVAADDFGQMVANAYVREGTGSATYYVYGPKRYGMKELLERYCRAFHPEIKKVSSVPFPILRIMAFLKRNKTLKYAIALFAYFEKVKEPEIPEEELSRLGTPELDFEAWVRSRKTVS